MHSGDVVGSIDSYYYDSNCSGNNDYDSNNGNNDNN